MVHTMIGIMYALNVLSRYGNNSGPRHIVFLKHLLKYCKYSKLDRLKFHTHDGPTDIKTMTEVLQLRFQWMQPRQRPFPDIIHRIFGKVGRMLVLH